MNEIKIPLDLLQAILDYLSKQPYIEVANIINAIQEVVIKHNQELKNEEKKDLKSKK